MTNSIRNINSKIYLVAGKRTAFGKFGGSLKNIKPVDLAVECSNSLLTEAKVRPDQIGQVLLGNVIPSSTDTLYGGRHLALKLGCPEKTPGYNINRLCGSGIQAIMDAVRLIKLDEAQCVLAAGVENMSMTPHLTYGARFGTKYGQLPSVDLLLDSLTDQYASCAMAITAENLSDKYSLGREECEQYAKISHEKAAAAAKAGYFKSEIAPIEIKGKIIDKDEHVRENISLEEMKTLRASFKKDGVVTPATASGIVDGACATLIASEKFCQENNLTPIAEIIDGKVVGVDPTIMGIGPVPAIKQLLDAQNLSTQDIDLFEINEAFAPQVMACIKELELSADKVNIWGGAIAIGHPLAATGTRITLTAARELVQLNKKYAIASACIGGGQGISILLKSV